MATRVPGGRAASERLWSPRSFTVRRMWVPWAWPRASTGAPATRGGGEGSATQELPAGDRQPVQAPAGDDDRVHAWSLLVTDSPAVVTQAAQDRQAKAVGDDHSGGRSHRPIQNTRANGWPSNAEPAESWWVNESAAARYV